MDKVEFSSWEHHHSLPLCIPLQTYVGCSGELPAPGGLKGNIMFGKIKDKGRAGALEGPKSSFFFLKPTQQKVMYCVQQTLLKISSKCSTRESGQRKVTVSLSDARTLCLLLAFWFIFSSRRIFFQALVNKTHLHPLTSLTIFLCRARLHVGGWYSLRRFPSLSGDS